MADEARLLAIDQLDHDAVTVQPKAIRRAANHFKANTTIGVHEWGFRDLAELDDEAFGAFGELLTEVAINVAVPVQTLIACLNLLRKHMATRERSPRCFPCTACRWCSPATPSASGARPLLGDGAQR